MSTFKGMKKNIILKNNRASSSNAFCLLCFSYHVVRIYVANIAQSLCNIVYIIDLVFFTLINLNIMMTKMLETLHQIVLRTEIEECCCHCKKSNLINFAFRLYIVPLTIE